MELILGTAQLDGRYGLFHQQPRSEPDQFLRVAWELGFSGLDTAPAYMDVETMIGQFGWKGVVHTKISPGVNPLESCQASLRRLQAATLDVLYFHDPSVLSEGPAFFQAVRERIDKKRVRRLGVSIYKPSELERAMLMPAIEAVQLPLNIADGRHSRELLESASNRGIALYARSVFLQGALLQKEELLPPYLWKLAPAVSGLKEISATFARSPLELALGWVKSFSVIRGVIVGGDQTDQLRAIGDAFKAKPLSKDEASSLLRLQMDDDTVLDPRCWAE